MTVPAASLPTRSTRWSCPGSTVRSVSQLTPELALDIAGRGRVVFVDANVDVAAMTVAAVAPGEAGPAAS